MKKTKDLKKFFKSKKVWKQQKTAKNYDQLSGARTTQKGGRNTTQMMVDGSQN